MRGGAGLAGAALLLALGLAPAAAAPAYHAGTILPSAPEAERDAALTGFYGRWKETYLRQGCGEGRFFVAVRGDGKPAFAGAAPDTLTVSEAQGYGMLAAVMMAPFDADAQRIFDGLAAFAADHPAASDPALMAWNQVASCASADAGHGGTATATDGDLDIAYALLLADRAWGSAGAVDYRGRALAAIAAIGRHEIADPGDYPLLGDWAGAEPAFSGATRVSDFMPAHFKAFFKASGDPRWGAVWDRGYARLAAAQAQFSPEAGLLPDFLVALDGTPAPAPPHFLEAATDGAYAWNAARLPWRVAADALTQGDARARALLAPLNAFFSARAAGDPRRLAAGYGLSGAPLVEPGGDTLAFLGPLAVSAMLDPAGQAWLDALWAELVARPVGTSDYYGNTIKLLALIVLSGHWGTP